jgi:lysophospholipase L1-like esterase
MNAFNLPPAFGFEGSRVLIAGGAGPLIFGPAANAAWFDLIRPVVLPAGTLQPGSALELDLLVDFQAPNAAGRAIKLDINGVLVGQAFPAAAMGCASIKFPFWVGNDARSLAAYGQSFNDVLSPAAGQGAPFSSHAAAPAIIAVDLSGETTIRVQAQPKGGDVCRVAGICLTQRRMPGGAGQMLPLNAISCWGDSLTSGLGATTPIGGWPSRLRQTLAGRGVSNFGVGGQTAAQVIDRLVADRVMGRHGIIIGWLGRNDVGVAGDLTAAVMTQHLRAVANLAGGATYLPGTIIPSATDTAGSANHNAILAANAAIRAQYPNAIDFFAALATEPDGTVAAANRSDTVHLNDAGYEIARTTVQTRLTAFDL